MFAVISFFYSGKNAMGRVMAFRQLFHCDLNAQNMKETIRDTKMMMAYINITFTSFHRFTPLRFPFSIKLLAYVCDHLWESQSQAG